MQPTLKTTFAQHISNEINKISPSEVYLLRDKYFLTNNKILRDFTQHQVSSEEKDNLAPQ